MLDPASVHALLQPSGSALALAPEPAIRWVELGAIWESLRSGAKRVARWHYAEGHCYVSLVRGGLGRPTQRGLAALEAAFVAQPMKRVAIEYDVAVSTVSVCIVQCLRSMGLTCSSARAPMLLAMSVHAHRGLVTLPPAMVRDEEAGELVVVPRPDHWLTSCLAPAEAHVASLRLEGLSGPLIAVVRGTSSRTVANQLGAIFRRFNVSGRAELLSLAIRGKAELRREAQPLFPTPVPPAARRSVLVALAHGEALREHAE